MVAKPFPSGDPLADRRADYAATMAHLGDMPVAIEVLRGALDIAPNWAAGWFRLGEYYELIGDTENAIAAWRNTQRHDPTDPFGAGLKIDLLLDVPVAESMPPAFVEMLFDQYAPRFETSLVEKLDYQGPNLIMEALRSNGFNSANRALDLGCGTGLMGAELRPHTDTLTGFDISQGMLDQAGDKGIYDKLEKHDIGALNQTEETYDLIIAADVFIYLGALERIIGWCAGTLTAEGRLAFSIEVGDQPIQLRQSRRIAHSAEYIENLLRDAGFSDVSQQPCVLRTDRGKDVSSMIFVASGIQQSPNRRDEQDFAFA